MRIAVRIRYCGVMVYDHDTVPGHAQIEFNAVHAMLQGFLKAGDGVLGRQPSGSAVADNFHIP